jgi:hypothetical protein
MRRILIPLLAVFVVAVSAARAEAVTIRDLIELSKAGLSDEVLIALIDVDQRVFTLDTATLKQLKQAGVSDTVIVALIRTARPRPEPAPAAAPVPEPRQPEVIVVDHHDPAPAPAAAPAPYPVPVAVPVYVPVPTRRSIGRENTVTTVLPTDQGLVKARVPVPANCVKAEPVYWGFGGKLRPGSWEPPPTVVCR